MFSRFRTPLFFVLIAVWFVVFQPWGSFTDPDAFYHAKVTSLMLAHGPLIALPWLDLTSLGAHFADQHFLFHFLMLPFVRVFEMLPGAQISTIFFAVCFSLVLFLSLRRLRVPYVKLWTLLALASPSLFMRLSLGKASPLALSWFVLGVTALVTRSPWLAFFTGAGFALTHGGWLILLGCQGLMLVGEILHDRVISDYSWRDAFRMMSWKTFFSSLAGMVLGFCLHPNAKQLPAFLWVQVVQVGFLARIDQLRLGSEWYPPTVSEVVASFSLLLMVALALCFGFLFARRVAGSVMRTKQVIALALPAAVIFALVFKSRRFIEYAIPLFVMWLAVLSTFVDRSRFRSEVILLWQERTARLKQGSRQLLMVLLISFLVFILGRQQMTVYNALNSRNTAFQYWSALVAVLRQHVPAGGRVYHVFWDEFPALFATADEYRYISGLDPTFLLAASSTLSDAYGSVAFRSVTSTDPYAVIVDQFHADAVLIDKRRRAELDVVLQSDARFTRIYDSAEQSLYVLEKSR